MTSVGQSALDRSSEPNGTAVVTVPPLSGDAEPRLHMVLALGLLATSLRATGLASGLRVTAVTPDGADGKRVFYVDLTRNRTFLGLLEDLARGGDPEDAHALSVAYTVGATEPPDADAALNLQVVAGTTGFLCQLRCDLPESDVELAESLADGMRAVSYAISADPGQLLSSLAVAVEKQVDLPPAADLEAGLVQDLVFDDEAAGPVRERPELDTSYAPPRSKLEQRLAGIWQRALSVDRVGIHDDFFELGGHSLVAAAVVLHLQEALQVDFPARTLYLHPTIAGLAQEIEAAPSSHPEGPA